MRSIPVTSALLRGAADCEATPRGLRPHRLPRWVRAQFPDPQLLLAEGQPSGVRLTGVTSAQSIELVVHTARVGFRRAPRPRGTIELVIDGALHAGVTLVGGDLLEVDLETGESEFTPGPSFTAQFTGLPPGNKTVELWLPHNESVEVVELRADAPFAPAPAASAVWVHHGSSISHGSNATTPTATWPAVAARLGGVELRNLGLSGSALVDPFAARVIRDTSADLISVKLGINVVNLDAMRERAFIPAVHGFLDTIRDGHPTTPLLLISPIFCGIHEDAPGPGAVDTATIGTAQIAFTASAGTGDAASGRLTLRAIRAALVSLAERRAGDPHLHYLDGTSLYGAGDTVAHPLPDALHPDSATHQLIGERFARLAFSPGGPFAAS